MNDRELASKVRTKALNDIHAVLEGDEAVTAQWSDYKKSMLMTLAKSILPRLNEHTGNDGGAIEIKGVSIRVRK